MSNEMKLTKPLVSVGLCTYNKVYGFKKMLNTLVDQTYENIEIIIGDNSTNDETKQFYEECWIKDSRIKYFKHQENIGSIKNFEFTRNKAMGKYFMWAADDDWWNITFIEKAVAKLEDENNAVACWSRVNFVNEKGEILTEKIFDEIDNIDLSSDNMVENLLKLNLMQNWYNFYCLIRTDIVKTLDIFYKKTFGHDVLFLNFLVLEGKCLFIDEKLFFYSYDNIPHTEKLNFKAVGFNEYTKINPYADLFLKIFEIILDSQRLSIFEKTKFYCRFYWGILKKKCWIGNIKNNFLKNFFMELLSVKDYKAILILFPLVPLVLLSFVKQFFNSLKEKISFILIHSNKRDDNKADREKTTCTKK